MCVCLRVSVCIGPGTAWLAVNCGLTSPHILEQSSNEFASGQCVPARLVSQARARERIRGLDAAPLSRLVLTPWVEAPAGSAATTNPLYLLCGMMIMMDLTTCSTPTPKSSLDHAGGAYIAVRVRRRRLHTRQGHTGLCRGISHDINLDLGWCVSASLPDDLLPVEADARSQAHRESIRTREECC